MAISKLTSRVRSLPARVLRRACCCTLCRTERFSWPYTESTAIVAIELDAKPTRRPLARFARYDEGCKVMPVAVLVLSSPKFILFPICIPFYLLGLLTSSTPLRRALGPDAHF